MPSLRSPGGEGGRHAKYQEILPDGLAVPAETGNIREGREKAPAGIPTGNSKSMSRPNPGWLSAGQEYHTF